MSKQIIYFFLAITLLTTSLLAQERKIQIWPSLAPGTEERQNEEEWEGIKKVRKVYQPDLTLFLPENQAKPSPAVIVCPGGGYRQVEMRKEGYKIAEWLKNNNIAAFVLKYRLNPPEALEDARQAIKVLREKAGQFNIDKNKIGIMGFSAGAHLSGNLAMNYKADDEAVNLRPDFWVGVYGVYRVMRENSDNGEIKTFGGLVDENSPPVFLVHAVDDSKVPVKNSVNLFRAYLDKGIPAELHVYEKGEHGFALETNRGDDVTSTVNDWSARMLNWLKVRKILN